MVCKKKRRLGRRIKVKYKVELPTGIKEQITKHSKKVETKRKVDIPLTSHTLRKYGKKMTVADLRKL